MFKQRKYAKKTELGILLDVPRNISKKKLEKEYEKEAVSSKNWQEEVYGNRGSMDDRLRMKLVKRFVERCKGDSFLDVGCWTGHYNRLFKNKFKKNIGVDISKKKIDEAKKLSKGTNIQFFVGDAENLKFASNSFDIVLCSETLEHLPNPKKALKELTRVSKRYLIITVPVAGMIARILGRYDPRVGSGHLHSFEQSKIENFLEKHGFDIVRRAGFYTSAKIWIFPTLFPFNRIGDYIIIKAEKRIRK